MKQIKEHNISYVSLIFVPKQIWAPPPAFYRRRYRRSTRSRATRASRPKTTATHSTTRPTGAAIVPSPRRRSLSAPRRPTNPTCTTWSGGRAGTEAAPSMPILSNTGRWGEKSSRKAWIIRRERPWRFVFPSGGRDRNHGGEVANGPSPRQREKPAPVRAGALQPVRGPDGGSELGGRGSARHADVPHRKGSVQRQPLIPFRFQVRNMSKNARYWGGSFKSTVPTPSMVGTYWYYVVCTSGSSPVLQISGSQTFWP